MQINSTLWDPGVKGFVLRLGGWRAVEGGGHYLDFSPFERGRRRRFVAECKDSWAESGGSPFRAGTGPGQPPRQVPGRLLGGWDGGPRMVLPPGARLCRTGATSGAERTRTARETTGWFPHNWGDTNVTSLQPRPQSPSPATPTLAITKDRRAG